MFELKDRVAVVTGGSRGIGRAICLALAEAGARVVVNYNASNAAADEVVRIIQEKGGKAFAHRADVSASDAAQGLVDAALEKFDSVDILVNNAGIVRDALFMAMSDEDWAGVMDVNLGGVRNCTRAVLQPMMMQKRGRIINISSTAGERAGRGQSNYAASKGAINALTRALAVELASKGITVNAIAPGMIETDMSSNVRAMSKDILLKSIPLGRYGRPEDIAPVAVFLASDEAGYLTGQVITVDGGLSGSVKM